MNLWMLKLIYQKAEEIPMKKFLKKLVVMSLLSGLILGVGKGGINKPKPMNEIDPGPANGIVR